MMEKSVFNPEYQSDDLSSKVVVGLSRISEVFKVLLWDKSKSVGLSPIQIQLLIFIAYHKSELCNVSSLAKEFNITKPTISDAIKALGRKELIIKDFSSLDSRSYSIHLSVKGEKIVAQTEDLVSPIKSRVDQIAEADLEKIFSSLSELIYSLNRAGILTVQRTCLGCKYYAKTADSDYCNLLQKPLLRKEIRLDCPEFQERVV